MCVVGAGGSTADARDSSHIYGFYIDCLFSIVTINQKRKKNEMANGIQKNTHVRQCCPWDCDVSSEKIHFLCQSRKNSNREVHAREKYAAQCFLCTPRMAGRQLAMRCFEDWNLLFGLPCFPCGVTVWCVQNWHFTHLIYELVNTIKIRNLLDCFMSSRYLCAPPFLCHSIRESRQEKKKEN